MRRGELRAIKVGGRGVWRVKRAELEAFIAAAYAAGTERGKDSGEPGAAVGGEKPADGAGGP